MQFFNPVGDPQLGIDELIRNIMDHKEHIELSGIINEKKKNRFTYKIRDLLYSKIEKLVYENLMSTNQISEFVNQALNDGKFKIYESIHNKFENIKLDIMKKE